MKIIYKPELTSCDLKILKIAVERTEEWRGTMTGNPDTGPLEEFDNFIREARQTLRKISKSRQ